MIIVIIMAPGLIVLPWSVLRILIQYMVCRTSRSNDQAAAKPLHRHTEQHKQNKQYTDTHASSGIQTHDLNVSDRAITVIGSSRKSLC
jgi:hypothetical protein